MKSADIICFHRSGSKARLVPMHSTSAPLPSSTATTAWTGVALVVAAGVIAALQVGKVAIAVPQLREDFGLGLSAIGWLMAVFSLLGVLGAIPVGAWIARAGDRRLLAAGLLALAVGSTIGALAGGLAALLFARVVEGPGFLLIVIAGPSLLQRIVAPAAKDLAFAIWSCFMPVGIAIAFFVGSVLEGWRGFWLANGLLALVLLALVLAAVPRGERDTRRLSWRDIAGDTTRTLAARAPLRLALSFAIYSLQFFALFNFLPVLLIERMGASVATAGLLSALACLANVGGNLAAGLLLARGTPRWLLVAIATATMGFAALGIFQPLLAALPTFVLCLLFSGAGGLLPATLLASAERAAPQPRLAPLTVGLLMTGNNVGQMIGPVLVGGAVEALGWPAAAAIVALASVAGLWVAMGLRPLR
jgi:predicted MFS family arabinose efflux permease